VRGIRGGGGVVRWVRVSGNWDALDWGRMNGEEWYDITFNHQSRSKAENLGLGEQERKYLLVFRLAKYVCNSP